MAQIQLPKDALSRIDLGKAFAENDHISRDPSVFVKTPASVVAFDRDNRKCFFVGRRGAGKTAIAIQLGRTYKRFVNLNPEVFDLIELPFDCSEFRDTRNKPFKSLVCVFERALLCELVSLWIQDKRIVWSDAGDTMRRDRGLIENCDFDIRCINLCDEVFEAFKKDEQRLWLRQINRSKNLLAEVNELESGSNFHYALIVDRLDEAWSGSESSIICLMALMHASLRLSSASDAIRPFIFIRENVFERVRHVDNEFSRLETSVVFLDWTEAKLVEMIERRCVKSFNTKPKVGGDAWKYFFQETSEYSSRKSIFDLCQRRPRELLMLCSFAMETAINRNHRQVLEEDVEAASERFSKSRLKDLGDEFAENYPNIQIVFGFFYGLSKEYTLLGIEKLIALLIVEPRIQEHCKDWFFDYTPVHKFIELFYSIGFLGIKDKNVVRFRDTGSDVAFMPKVDSLSTVVIHTTYASALRLSDTTLSDLPDVIKLKDEGVLAERPEGLSFQNYKTRLVEVLEDLKTVPMGVPGAASFEEVVGEIIKLCFFRALTNVQPKARTVDNRTIKDWVTSNQAIDGFWARVRDKYSATQVFWECKNYEQLSSSDFHQASYYMNSVAGRFSILVFRGAEVKNTYYEHVSRVMVKNSAGLILILRQRDLEVFLRQAIKGASTEAHISERFDETERRCC